MREREREKVQRVDSSLVFKETNPCWIHLLDLNVLHLPQRGCQPTATSQENRKFKLEPALRDTTTHVYIPVLLSL